MIATNITLFSRIKYYRKLSQELQMQLTRDPHDWPRFQEIFNLSVDRVYDDILQFEKEHIDKAEARVYKLKKIFEKRYRHYFLYGDFIRWSFEKPFGYAGDFKIIDEIYKNEPCTIGFDRLWDNYFQRLGVSHATRERKEDFKGIIANFVKEHKNQDVCIMDLACGPGREIKELLEENSDKLFSHTIFHCYDLDIQAIDYAKHLLYNMGHVEFFQKNAIRLALKKDIKEEISREYDVIYSTGLFDYLDERVAVRLVGNLKRLLKKGGMLVISNVRDKFSNPSASWMEWVAEWNLIYRTEREFEKVFTGAGFSEKDIQIVQQRSKVMQYCLAQNK